jgi:hypothetical protein
MATRLYLPNVAAPPVTPTFDAAWGVTASADRASTRSQKLHGTPVVAKTSGTETSTSPINVLNRQYISAPLNGAQTITGTVQGTIRAGESNAAADMRAQTVIRVVSNDGTVVRGTLWAADASALSSEFPITGSAVSKQFPLAALTPWTLTSVAALDGDRIVIEVGARAHNVVATAYSHTLHLGDAGATDLSTVEGTNSANPPWFEFSQTLNFKSTAISISAGMQVLVKGIPKGRVYSLSAQTLIKTPQPKGRAVSLSMQTLIKPLAPTGGFDGWGTEI